MNIDPADMKWRRLDGNHGYCATRCPNCGSSSEIYTRYIDETFWCQDCDCNWSPYDPDVEPLAEGEKP